MQVLQNPDNSTITFTISDTTNYKIDSSTGEITLTEAGADLVNSGQDLPNFTVSASSSTGDTGTSSTVDPASTTDVDDGLSVTVSNVIDSITEGDADTSTVVGNASSTNPDNSTITFTISDTTNYKIDSSTGRLH